MRKFIVFCCAFVLLTGCFSAGQAAIMSKEELYRDQQDGLKRYLNGEAGMDLNALEQGWQELGYYEMSQSFLLYTQALKAVQENRYADAEELCDVLALNEKFCALMAETEGFRSVKELKNYVLGRKAEAAKNLTEAVEYYSQSSSFMDSMARIVTLKSVIKTMPTPTPIRTPQPIKQPTPAPAKRAQYAAPARTVELKPAMVKTIPVSLAVYSGPGTAYFRAVDGKAKFGGGDVDLFGKVGDWYLISYWPGSGGRRVGYVQDEDGDARINRNNSSPLPLLLFSQEKAMVHIACSLTDDPYDSLRDVVSLAEGTDVVYLATLRKDNREVERDWAYIEVPGNETYKSMRGFVPMENLRFYH